MTNSHSCHPASSFETSADMGPGDTSKVHGWLLGVQEYGTGLSVSPTKAPETSGSISSSESVPRRNRPLSISSISSEDSVNLEDLIKANYASDMDDETALSDLAELDLDDSDEEFWKLDMSIRPIPRQTSSVEDRLQSLSLSTSPLPQQSHSGYLKSNGRHRSGSQSSENSFTSQSTITITSHHLRGNSNTSHIPLPPRPASQLSTQSTKRLQPTAGMLQQSRSSTDTSISRPSSRIAGHAPSRLAKRASHIPTPASMTKPPTGPAPQRTLSTRSSTAAANSSSNVTARETSILRTPSRLANRASHIPMTATSRAKSPIPSRMTSNGQQQRNSIFGSDFSRIQRSTTVHAPSPTKSTGAVRSASRIGMASRRAV